jgi:hypothetical protein
VSDITSERERVFRSEEMLTTSEPVCVDDGQVASDYRNL